MFPSTGQRSSTGTSIPATCFVDWANACRGPWGCDIAHCRSLLIELDGIDAADRFLTAYQSLTGRAYDPY
jgi:hypothetical protein